MTVPARPGRWSAAIIVAGLALVLGIGLVVEGLNLLPALTFALQRSPDRLPSTTVVPRQDIQSGVPILSLSVGDDDLHDPVRGLLTHTMERGPDWERTAFVSYFQGGQLLFGAPAGLRIHGGKSRQFSPVQSYRLYFERRFGATQVGQGVLFAGASDPLRRVVVHNDLRADRSGRWWHFVSPLAYDIASRLGAITPRTQPVRLYLNGSPQGAYVLTEHVTSKGFLRAHFGRTNYTTADGNDINRLRRWLRAERPLTMGRVDTVVDVSNLTSWFLSMLFCATTDAFQGVMLRDGSDETARWFWVVWDMDHSFMDLYGRARVPWEHDTFRTLLRAPEVRSEIVTRLLAEDPAYQAYFKAALAAMLNHRLTSGFLMERFEHYAREAQVLHVAHTEYLAILQEFLTRRPNALLALAERHLPGGRSHRCTLTGPPGTRYVVDGFASGDRFEGICFEGTTFRVESAGEQPPLRWMVNGQPHGDGAPAVEIPVGGDLDVQAEFR